MREAGGRFANLSAAGCPHAWLFHSPSWKSERVNVRTAVRYAAEALLSRSG